MTNSHRSPRRAARTLLAAALLGAAPLAQAFCGFYVGKADASLFNEASQVIVARDGDRTVISMLNDYKGELTEFALVVPVPQVLERGQVRVGERRMFDRIDAYSAPRLAEYFDPDPCAMRRERRSAPASSASQAEALGRAADTAKALGVTVEASYTVGEYDIVMLSATQSDGLQSWLAQNGYRIPPGAAAALAPYVRQGMKFFVARVNLEEQARTGFTTLRPLQFAFESPKFMLPMRLGMINASGPQDLIVYLLTRNGRVESSNYRTLKLPANVELPIFVRNDFSRFYRTMFAQQAQRENHRAVFTEYFWDMSWCDPCAADPLSTKELRDVGVFWLDGGGETSGAQPPGAAPFAPARRTSGAQPVKLTRLHLRYTSESFPEDLMFTETRDRANFQVRYVLRHPYKVEARACDAAPGYLAGLVKRQEREAQTLSNLTGWNITEVRTRAGLGAPGERDGDGSPWWRRLWPEASADRG
ncbi:MAG: DUF2330 domain-containing protein [Burkholderiaceae bacterium]|nr:DUF2330 domain-containing protein [Burkholderiaceae bacterium]